MRIAEKTVAEVVQEASAKMSDPNYSAVLVGGFVQEQPATCEYIKSNLDEMGGAEAVVNCIFHAALIAVCFQRGNNRSVRTMEFDDLDYVSDGDRKEKLEGQQPAILAYIEENVENDGMKRVLMLIALAMEWVS
ncbi:MAG: hypothetical protein KJO07_10980 [Deltaproteobacteria bacterium]|jgi:hypothetical protein|nr:hypothetical protein [Deltaproteobacteria bacterium]